MPDSSLSETVLPPALAVNQRSDEILDACKRAFATKGFDGATMQDLARAAGMSASNFYRYFESKDAIIVAIVDREMTEIEATFARIDATELLRPMLLSSMASYLNRDKDQADGMLWAEMQAAAKRRPAIGAALQRMEEVVTTRFILLFARVAGISVDEARQRFRPQAAMLFLLSRGALMSRCGPQPLTPVDPDALMALVIRATDQILDDISSQG